MLSYQHMYHAGCLADVQKHAALAMVLSKMVEKDKPISYMETHAGRGLYDLDSVEANKTGEAKEGILSIEPQGAYKNVLDKVKDKFGKTYYPGSPIIAREILRKSDRLHLMELHPAEHEVLRENLNYENVSIHKQDGYQQVLAISPPDIRRGFVLIDPSYEVKSEYEDALKFIEKMHRKWAEAVIMLWYPILEDGRHKVFEKLKTLPKFWQQEIFFKSSKQRALGTGLIVINLPYGVEEDLSKIKGII